MWGGVSVPCYRRMKPRLCLCERREKMARKVGENGAKAWRKSSHIDRCEHGERSMPVFITTVVNMSNGRCEMTCCCVLPNFFVGFIWFSLGFRLIISMLLLDDLLLITRNIAWFCSAETFAIMLCINDNAAFCAPHLSRKGPLESTEKVPPPFKNQNEKSLQFITVLSKNCLNKAIINRKRKGKRAYFSVFNFKYESISYFFSAHNLRALSSRQ